MHYVLLALAVIAETIGTSAMKISDGFTKPLPALLSILSFSVALFLMAQVLRVMPVGVVYAIWSGLGVVSITTIGWFVFNQKLDTPALIGIAFIIAGVLILNLFSKTTLH